jgi:hypothetical protein
MNMTARCTLFVCEFELKTLDVFILSFQTLAQPATSTIAVVHMFMLPSWCNRKTQDNYH